MSKKIWSGIADGALRDTLVGKGRKRLWKPRGEPIPGHRIHEPSRPRRNPNWKDYLSLLEEEDLDEKEGS
jgi:hypothetical protein